MTTEYSKEVIEKALDLLQITTQEKRAEMEAAIYRAAAEYNNAKKEHAESYRPPGFIDEKIKALIYPLEQFKQKYADFLTQAPAGKLALMETTFPFVGKKEYTPDAAEYVRAFLHEKPDGKIAFNPYGFLGFLELFEKAIKAANAPNDGMKKGFPVYIWLATLCPAWKKCSTIDFTGGHHMGKDVGYVTPAITILEMLMKPIDKKVENKTLGYQLKEVNRVYDLVEKNPPPAA